MDGGAGDKDGEDGPPVDRGGEGEADDGVDADPAADRD